MKLLNVCEKVLEKSKIFQRKIILLIAIILVLSSFNVMAWDPNPTYNPFEVVWNAINKQSSKILNIENNYDSTEDTIADDDVISSGEVNFNYAGSTSKGGPANDIVCISCIGSVDVNTGQVQRRIGGTCSAGSSIRAINEDGTVTCETDDDSILWSQSGSDIYYDSGNVGIGTTTPTKKLHVIGDANVTDLYLDGQDLVFSGTAGGNTASDSFIRRVPPFGRIDIKPNDATYGVYIRPTSGNSYGNIEVQSGYLTLGHNSGDGPLYITSTNVGIGTATPSAKLDVEVSSGGAATIGSSLNSATGDYAVAMGHNTDASEERSTAMGAFTTASGSSSTAMGYGTTASGYASTAMGNSATASGSSSTAMGLSTTASGEASTAMGRSTTASGQASIAIGYGATASMTSSTAIGSSTTASQTYSTAMGHGTTASGSSSTAMGSYIEAAGAYSVGIGLDGAHRIINEPNTMAIMGGNVGIGTTNPDAKLDVEVNSGGAATIGSSLNSATGDYAVAMGHNTDASGYSSTAMGNSATASGSYSTAMGYNAHASGQASTAMGSATASGPYSTAMGSSTIASGYYSTAMGRGIEAAGDYSVGIGLDSTYRIITQDNIMAIMGGNVGIGTVSPSEELEVVGTAKATNFVGDGTIGSCYVRKVSETLLADTSAWKYATCNTGDKAISCGSYTPQKDVITTMSGYMPSDVTDGGSIPNRCIILWDNQDSLSQTVYGFATCCPI